MKNKKIAISIIAVLCIFFIGITLFLINKPKSYTEINFEEYMELFESEEKFVLFIGATSCSHCTAYKKTADRIVKEHKITINYIDIDKLEDSEYAHINAHFPFSGTPTTIIVENKEEIGRIDGKRSFSDSVTKLKKAGIIEE